MSVDGLHAAIEPVVSDLGLELVDVELAGATGGRRTLRVTIDREGGVDLDAITDATRAISPVLDAQGGPSGAYTLEVSSPGLERPLRTPEHFRRAVGATVSIKARGADGSIARRRGVVLNADDTAVEVDFDGSAERVAYTDITQARTVFDWGAPPPPARSKREKKRAKEHSR
jgi:ribosome maturation factor RimP